jgi:hypothetical protein
MPVLSISVFSRVSVEPAALSPGVAVPPDANAIASTTAAVAALPHLTR